MIVDIDKPAVSSFDNHVSLTVAVDIFEGQRNRGKILTITSKDRSIIEFGSSRVVFWYFDHFHVSMPIDSDEVTHTIMSDVGVGLIGTRMPIDQVIMGGCPAAGVHCLVFVVG